MYALSLISGKVVKWMWIFCFGDVAIGETISNRFKSHRQPLVTPGSCDRQRFSLPGLAGHTGAVYEAQTIPERCKQTKRVRLEPPTVSFFFTRQETGWYRSHPAQATRLARTATQMEQWSHDPRSVVSTPAALRTLAGGAWRRATAAMGRSNLFSFDAFSADGANDKRASGDGSGRPVVPATYGSTLAGLSRFLLLFSATAVSIGDRSPGQFATAGQLNRSWLAGGDLNAGMLVLSPEGERETRRRVGGLEVELNACRTEVEGQTETLAYIADRVAALESMVMQHDHELAMRDR